MYRLSGLTAKTLGALWLAVLLPTVLLCNPVAGAAERNLKLVVTAAFVSEKGMGVYQELAGYLSGKLGYRVDVVSGTSYEESDMLLQRGIVQIGFVCGLPYTHNAAKGIYQLVAIPVMAIDNAQFADAPDYAAIPGKYYSYTIVRKDSKLSSWADLKGHSYVYNEKNSNSGYNMPRYKLVQLGVKRWEDYFSKIEVSGSHEQSIRMVARGLVDASSVDSMVLDYDRNLGDADAMNVRIIEVLFPGGAGIPPVVVTSSVDAALRQQLQDAFTHMHEDAEGKRILAKALIKRFAPPDDANYDDVRAMEAAAHAAGFIDYAE